MRTFLGLKIVKISDKKAYSRMSLLTKLKNVGVEVQDLLEIYILISPQSTQVGG